MWKDYFGFNKRQRNGIMVLLVLIMGMMVYLLVADYFPSSTVKPDFASFKAEVDKAKPQDTITKGNFATKPDAASGATIEINSADSTELIKLPGMRGKVANTIIHFRDALGGYYSKEQLKEVYGLDSAEYVSIANMVTVDAGKVDKIDINGAKEKELAHHPYIRKKLAKAIYDYRKENGMFTKLADLKKVDGMDEEKLVKLLPYLRI